MSAEKPCIDVIVHGEAGSEDANVLAPGESNFLPAGTTLHAVQGFPAEERLAWLAPEGEWRVLARLEHGG